MPLSTATVTFDISDHFGGDYDRRRGIRGWVDTNIPSDTVIDADGNKIRVGSGKVTFNDDGTGSFTLWTPGVGSNPASWQTYFHVEYVDMGNHAKGRTTRTFGPFTITGNADLADLVSEQEVPPEYVGTLFTQLEAIRDEAQAARDEAVDISEISTPDAVIANRITTPGSATEAALSATFATPNAAVWIPPGTNAATNAASLEAAIAAAVTAGKDLQIKAVGTVDIAGPVDVAGSLRVFGLGRDMTTLRQTVKPEPLFYVNAQDVTLEDFTVLGTGLNFTVGIADFQDYNGVRIERGSHGFAARRLRFTDIYVGMLFRNMADAGGATIAGSPVRTERVVIEDIEGSGVWCVIHGGPFDSPRIDNIRGTFTNATGHADTNGHAPHLVYINTPTPTSGIYTDAFYTRGGTITNLSTWDGPNFIGAAFSFKHCRGVTFDNLTTRNTRGVLELLNMQDCAFGVVTSFEDKYPATGSDAARASISYNTCQRVVIAKATIAFANVDHGRALRFEGGTADSSDCRVDSIEVIDNSNTDRSTGTVMYDIYIQGTRNIVRNPTLTNLGQPRWAGIVFASTGSGGQVLNPRIGEGYKIGIQVNADHQRAVIDHDPLYVKVSRVISSASKITADAGANPTIRDRSIGQTLGAGFVDELDRGVTVTGLAATDDGKTWVYRDSGAGNPASWRASAAGTAGYIGAGARALALVDGLSANGTLKTTIGALTGFGSGLAVRATDFNNYIGLMFSSAATNGQLDLHKRVGGTRTAVAQSALAAVAADSVVEIVMAGTSISVKVNGVQVIAPQTIADFPAVTLHGLLGTSDGVADTLVKRLEFVAA